MNVLFEDYSLFEAIDYADNIRKDSNYLCMDIRDGYVYVLLNIKVSPYEFNNNSIIYKDSWNMIIIDFLAII